MASLLKGKSYRIHPPGEVRLRCDLADRCTPRDCHLLELYPTHIGWEEIAIRVS
jgi:hypothetical protein